MAVETLDHEAHRHRQGLKETQHKKSELEKKYKRVQDGLELRLKQYRPIFQALDDKGVLIEDPGIAAAENEINRRNQVPCA